MTTNRLYTVAWIYDDTNDEPYDLEGELEDVQRADPDGWAEFCEAKWGEYKPFFWPSTRGIFKSRSAAQRRAAMITYWGGKAEVLECTPQWQSVESANRERAQARLAKRIRRMQDELDAQKAKLAELADARSAR